MLKCTKALLAFGAPSHRIEADLDFAAGFWLFQRNSYTIRIASVGSSVASAITATDRCSAVVNFGNAASYLSDTVTVKHVNGGLDLGSVSFPNVCPVSLAETLHQLHKVNELWRELEKGSVTVKEATLALADMMHEKPIFRTWHRVLLAASMSGLICPMGFSGSLADAMLAAVFAGILTWLKLGMASQNQRFGDVFE